MDRVKEFIRTLCVFPIKFKNHPIKKMNDKKDVADAAVQTTRSLGEGLAEDVARTNGF